MANYLLIKDTPVSRITADPRTQQARVQIWLWLIDCVTLRKLLNLSGLPLLQLYGPHKVAVSTE